ncbi:centriole and centriolar satellite protein OFD1-like [Antedon mediterranea]|uniref:centriole and centriolar satellite protein OFD1-like n=1 Tax=Antedon mediterranea TaxID=105859 RepID=UPI003AF8CCCE
MEEAEFTSDEFKTKLYQSFKERGVIQNLKSQLRSKLVVELRNSALNQDFSKSTVPLQEENSLLHRASNSLVADHLRRCQYEYSLAVFLPESCAASDKLFSTKDLLQLLKINPDSKLYRKIASSQPTYHSKGFLWELLCEIANSHSGGSECKGVQADLSSHSSLVDKLEDVDREFRSRAQGEDFQGSNVITEKMLSFQREIETRSKEQLNLEITRFKENECRNIEMEEREKFRVKLDSSRKELEQLYGMKCKALEERERNATERLQQQQQIVQKEMHSQRQSLLEELQMLRSKEAEVRRESEINKRAAKLEEDKRIAVEENLKLRETAVHNIEETYKQRLKEQLTQYDLKKRKEYMDRLEDVERRERHVRDEARKLNEESEMNKEIKQQLKDKQQRIEEIQNNYQGAKNELISSNKNNELLQEKLRDMVDYQQLKENNAVMRRELENTKMRLAESSNEYKTELARQDERMQLLSMQASQPSHEVVSMKAELHRARDRIKQEKALMESREAQLNSKLQSEVNRSRELQRQLDEQTLQMKEMNRELQEVRTALQETRTALSNEVYRKPNKSSHFKDVPVHDIASTGPNIHSNSLTSGHHDEDVYLPIRTASAGHEPILEHLDQFETSLAWEQSPTPDTSLAFLENTRERFRSLDREAENLEQSYKNFQHKLSNPNALNSPKRIISSILSPTRGSMTSRHRPELKTELSNDNLTTFGGRQRRSGVVTSTSQLPAVSSNTYSISDLRWNAGGHSGIYPVGRTDPSNSGIPSQHQSSTGTSYRNQRMPEMPSSGVDLGITSQPLDQITTGLLQGRNSIPNLPQGRRVTEDFHQVYRAAQDTPQVHDIQSLPTINGEVEDDHAPVSSGFVQNGNALRREDTRHSDPGSHLSNVEEYSDPINALHSPSLDRAWKKSSDQHSAAEVTMPSLDRAMTNPEDVANGTIPLLDGASNFIGQSSDVNMPSLDGAWNKPSNHQPVAEVSVPSLDGAWKTPSFDQSISLDSSWKKSEQLAKDEEKRKQDEKEWEERRIQRMEERQKKEQEAREREKKMLEELEKQEASQKAGEQSREVDNDKKDRLDGKESDVKEENEDDGKIDPIMQKYMKMVQEKQDSKQNKTSLQKLGTFDLGSPDYVEVADVKSIGGVSDTSDPFADW